MAVGAGSVVARINADISGYVSAMNKVQSSTAQSTGTSKKGFSSLKSTILGTAAGVGAVALVSKGVGVLKDSVGAAVARFDTLNSYPKVMKQMGYSTDDTNKSVSIMKKGIDGLPTSLQDITKSSQSFAILTGSATKGSKAAIALNDAFLASGASAGDASRGTQQFSQMLATGTVDMQSWRTLQETMPYALNETAKAFGFTGKSATNDFYKALQNGQISTDQFLDKLIELDGGTTGFANTAREATKGIGTSFTNMRNAVTNGLAETVTAIDNGLKNAGIKDGIAGLMDQAKQGIVTGFQVLNGAVQTAIPVLISAFQTFVVPVINILKKLFDFINQNKDWIMPLVIAGGTFAATITAINGLVSAVRVLTVLASVASNAHKLGMALNMLSKSSLIAKVGLSAFNGATKVATAVQTAFNAVMALNPFVLLGVAIAAVVAGLAYWITQTKSGQKAWQTFTDWLKGAWSGMVEFFSGIWSAITEGVNSAVEGFKTAWQGTVDFFKGLWAGIGEFFSGIWNGITTTVTTVITTIQTLWQNFIAFIQPIWQSLLTIFQPIWDAITQIVQTVVTTISNLWTNAVTTLTGIWNGITTVATSVWTIIKNAILGPVIAVIQALSGNWNGAKSTLIQVWNNIKSAASSAWNGVKQIVSSLTRGVVTAVKTIWNSGKSVVMSIWNGIRGAASATWNAIKSVISSLVRGAVNTVKSVWNSGKAFITSIWNGIRSTASNVWNGIRSTITSLARSAANGLRAAWSGLTGWVSNIFNSIRHAIHSALNINLFSVGQNIIRGLWNGMKGVARGLMDFVGNLASKIVSTLKGALKIHSPSRVMAEIGMYTGQGLVNGISGMEDDVLKSTTNYADAIKSVDYTPEASSFSSWNAPDGSSNGNYRVTPLLDNVTDLHDQITATLPDSDLVPKPAHITFELSNESFTAFAEDINRENGERIRLTRSYGI